MYKIKANVVLDDNPVTTYSHRQLANFNQEFFNSKAEEARTMLINHLNDLIIEYSEETEKATQGDNVR